MANNYSLSYTYTCCWYVYKNISEEEFESMWKKMKGNLYSDFFLYVCYASSFIFMCKNVYKEILCKAKNGMNADVSILFFSIRA